jgi:leucyl-tRNA synthetase
MERYDPQAVEAKWQKVWEEAHAFEVANPEPGPEQERAKFYMLEMLPYPTGELHMGHVLNYTLGDVLTHFHRRNGRMVLRPMGFDSFGLPAENAAIREGIDPLESTERNIASITKQMRRLGWAIDWSRAVSAHEPRFYRWTQWLFLKLFEAGHAYRKEALVNWCPKDQTVLANEHVVDGRCWRCGTLVEARRLEQWFFRITAYADVLLDDLNLIDWPEQTKAIQRNWIGRSEGAEILFRVDELDIDIPVFTTRPDTLFGATFFVLAPEHPLVDALARGPHEEEIREYVNRTATRTVEERADPDREKTGVFTGRHAENPATGDPLPIWIADYVLMDYGTGAIMAVPAHDERDLEFAQRFELPVKSVVDEDGRMMNSGEFDGRPAEKGRRAIVEWLRERGRGAVAINHRLRDWGFSRQRYWGSPIPIVYCDSCGIVPLPEDELPVLLPEIEDYRPKGKPPLAGNEDWLRVSCPRCEGEARREAETMDTFVDSAWYYLRYCDPDNETAPFGRDVADFWMPVDQYVGGIEHATGHLLYSRFFTKVLNELGLVGFREPFQRLFHQGSVNYGGARMSKSRGNVVSPDAVIASHGADAARLYILFMGPADQAMDWTDSGVEGISRFLRRLWRAVNEVASSAPTAAVEPVPRADDAELIRAAHETIALVTDDIARRFQFNTPIAAVMKLLNELAGDPTATGARFAAETAVSLIQPYAPHIAEELWETLGHERLWEEQWPQADPAWLERDTYELVVQVNGRVRDRLEVSSALSEDELVERAKASPRVRAHLDGKEIRRVFFVPRKLVNLVVA